MYLSFIVKPFLLTMGNNIILNELDRCLNTDHYTAVFDDLSPCNTYINSLPSALKLIHLNIRSINKNFSEFCVLLESFTTHFDVIVLTESWLDHNHGFDINGYNKFVKINKYNKCDGLVVYFRDNISPSEINIEIDHCNSINFSFMKNDISFVLTAIYRSPKLCTNDFLESLEFFLQSTKNYNNHIIVGDINIQILENNLDILGNNYLNIMHEHGFTRYLNAITREAMKSNSCLDHIFLKADINLDFNPGVYKSAITDHNIVFTLISPLIKNSIKNPMDSFINSKTTINYRCLISQIRNMTWESVLNCQDADKSFEILYNILRGLISKCTVSFNTPSKLKKIKPWITSGIIQSIRTRDKLAKQTKQDPNNIALLNKFKKYRNALTRVIRHTKINYYSEKFNINKSNPKKFWQTVNEATDTETKIGCSISEIINQNNSIIQDKKDIANEFNDYFTSIGQTIISKINKPPSNSDPLKTNNCSTSMFLFPITENEIISLVKGLKNNVAPGIDGITNKTLKIIIEPIVKPLTYVFNLCIAQGIFPSYLKFAVVVPLHKSGDRKSLNNYRPISLLPALSKILEKCIKTRLMNYLEKYSLLNKNQFGFRNNMSTDDALMNVTSRIITELDSGKKCVGVFLDIKKAFDTVNHAILLNKLDSLGIKGTVHKFFKSYLTNRLQVTKINDQNSNVCNINIGVPQGTVLGPILFLIYINDLLDIDLENMEGSTYSYADDTAVIFSGKDWKDTFRNANMGINIIKDWLDRNLLSLNISKTIIVPFSLNNSSLVNLSSMENAKVIIHNCKPDANNCTCPALDSRVSIKYLGVIIDQHLKWDKHIAHVCNRLRKTIHKFVILRAYMPTDILRLVYLALVQSVIQYGIIAWGGITKTNLNPLYLLQKRIIKICLRKPLDYPTNLIFSEFKVSKIDQIFKQKLLLYFHKNYYSFKTDSHDYHTRRNDYCLLHEPKCSTSAGSKHARNFGPKFYNSIIKDRPELSKLNPSRFKNKIKNVI